DDRRHQLDGHARPSFDARWWTHEHAKLMLVFTPHRDHEAAAGCEPRVGFRRDLAKRRADFTGIEERGLRPAAQAVAVARCTRAQHLCGRAVPWATISPGHEVRGRGTHPRRGRRRRLHELPAWEGTRPRPGPRPPGA